MDALLVRAAVDQLVDQPGIAVEVEDDGFIGGEEGIEVAIAQPVGCSPSETNLKRSTTLTNRTFR